MDSGVNTLPADGAPTTSAVVPAALFIDLDGTLVQGDLLHEALVGLLFRRPWWLLATFCRHRGAPAPIKHAIAQQHMPEVETLPYRADVIALIESRRQRSMIVLATAAHRAWAERIATHLGGFTDVLASDGRVNLKGPNKLDAIREWCARHGCTTWGYVGDAACDLDLWRAADEAVAVEPGPQMRHALKALRPDARFLGAAAPRVTDWAHVLRVRQWVKNLLVLAPIPLSQSPPTGVMLARGTLAALAFCCAASAIYIVNDVLDMEADRRHPQKRSRPFAAGQAPLLAAPLLAVGLLAAAGGVAAVLGSPAFCILLAAYVVLTLAYSLFLKRAPIVDVLTLAALYLLRILAGGAATGVPISEWLMAFSMFFFFSLALVKRHSELLRLAAASEEFAAGRGYRAGDAGYIQMLGTASGMIAVLVFALFAHSPEARGLYPNHAALWLACPLLALWLGRVWLYSSRGTLSEDPVLFAVRDTPSILSGVALLGCILYSRGQWPWLR